MDRSCLGAGVPVVTAKDVGLSDMAGSGVNRDALKNRRAGSVGTVEAFVPQQGGEVWLVKHSDNTLGVYHHEELALPRDACLPRGYRGK